MTNEIEDLTETMLRYPDPVVTANDMAEEMDCSRRHALDLLKLAESTGKVTAKTVGARATAWWHVDRVRNPQERPDQKEQPREVADEPDPMDAVENVVNGLDLPGSGNTLEARRNAVRDCCQLLRDTGSASRSDFVGKLYSRNTAGYGSEGGWWNTIGKQGLREVAETTEMIERPKEGEHSWRWVG